ncbi:MAG: type II secretion system protein [Alphaproteobacteria bacterium]|nr:type II secretion system protein [Alphaproteobacteria bacterium]
MRINVYTSAQAASRSANRGFTLVELAIVMTVIGIVVGSIIKGQEMIKNARATATIAQMQAYQTAVIGFRDAYKALPGDMRNAQSRIPNCTANCAPHPDNSNDNIIGRPDWSDDWNAQAGMTVNLPAASAADETVLFWAHLTLSDMIGGVNNAAIRSGNELVAWTHTHPASPIGGGFVVGFVNGQPLPGDPRSVDPVNPLSLGPRGLVFMILNSPTSGTSAQLSQGSYQVMSVTMAALIDGKIDDGYPHTGRVRGYGLTDVCFGGDEANPHYAAGSGMQDCGIIFEMAQ